MIARIGPVTAVDDTGTVGNVNAYRSPLIPSINTNALSVQATSLTLPGHRRHLGGPGPFPERGHRPRAGRRARRRRRRRVWASTASTPASGSGSCDGPATLCGQWFYLVGILNPAVLAPEIDTSVLIGYPAAEKYLGFDGHPSEIYLRADTDQVNAVHDVCSPPPPTPSTPTRSTSPRPSDALVAQADAKGALNSLFLGLGAVSLLVGAIGVGNVMLIGVLERRSEIGLRRALGATKGHIRIQFLTEAMLLALLGGAVGVGLGAAATAVYAHTQHWATVIPPLAWAGGLAAALAIGAIAGLLPAIRAARMSPTQALWSV